MPTTKWAATAKWGWSYADGRYLGIEVEGTTASGKPTKGTLKADNLNTLKRWLVERRFFSDTRTRESSD